MDPITPLNKADTVAQEQSAASDDYVMRVLVAADMLANVTLGGHEGETISTDAGLMAQKHVFIGSIVSRLLDFCQADHGAKAAAGDLERAQAEQARLASAGIVNQ